jgi:hypothetical protein
LLVPDIALGGKSAARRKRELKAHTKISKHVHESHFDSSLVNPDETRRRVGRPFKGDVEEFTREPHVPERRSILRGFKKFYSKREFDGINHA